MRKKIFGLSLSAMLFALSFSIGAQQAKKVPRIGYVGAVSPSTNPARIEAFRHGLSELGYVEGKNIVIEYRWAEGKLDRLSEFAAELVRLKVDAIITGGPNGTRAAKEATSTIPIVMAADSDPVADGFVANLARLGGNITGLSTIARELSGKRLELLKEAIPKVSRIAVLWDPANRASRVALTETEAAAQSLGIQLQSLEVRAPTPDIEGVFKAALKGRAMALIVIAGFLTNSHRAAIVGLAVKNRLPAISTEQEFVPAGGLMSYSTNYADLHRRAAVYLDKILRGAKPADLPVEQPTKFELVINLKTAKQIGVTIPQSVLFRADKVIK